MADLSLLKVAAVHRGQMREDGQRNVRRLKPKQASRALQALLQSVSLASSME